MRITAKVEPHAAKAPTAVVRDALAQAHAAAAHSRIDEVFPESKKRPPRRNGDGYVTQELRAEESEAVLKALRDHDDIEYAERATPRRGQSPARLPRRRA